ncbi:hypothetical protein ACFWMG_18940 [Streptomyces sp. NPDC127074]|uniref:hypothetical protein n=1 Tax=Streptomyces sp. NPDC127074 TaxID=3347130 RepID=UPI003662576E
MARAYEFPPDLLTAQEELDQVADTLKAPTDGWSEGDQAEVQQLRARQQKLSITLATHPFWATLDGPDRVAARRMLKHARHTPTAETTAA